MAPSSWEFLSNYESYALVKKDYAARHGWTLNSQASREISAPFSHARSFFVSASNADLTVKPLLLYYGVVALSRGVTLLLTKALRESSLASSHGLRTIRWQQELAVDHFDVSKLRVEVAGVGSLPELSKATRHTSLLRLNSSAVNYAAINEKLSAGSEYVLGDLLSRIPELSDQNFRWQGVRRCLRGGMRGMEGGQFRMGINKLPGIDRQMADGVVANTPMQFVSDGESFDYDGVNDISKLPGLADRRDQVMGIGDLHFVARYPDAPFLNKISAAFTLAYFLGMLVRYHPTQWTAMIRAQVSDAAIPTLLSAIEYIEKNFPTLAMDYIEYSKW